MSSVIPVPSSRVPNQLARDRLVRQLSGDQIDLAKLQTQISTGRRVLLPSDDAPAALRGIALQQLLERKAQVQTNLQTNQSFLSATDSAISHVSDLLNSARATALGVLDTGASDAQRAAAAQEIDRAIQQLTDIGNQKFRGRYLFSGSATTTSPFTNSGLNVAYAGNESRLQSYADTDLLFDTNANGSAVFGALSAPVKGADLNPAVDDSTLLANLRGGQGIAKGSIAISDGTKTVNVDLSGASTIGDVKALIEAHAPAGRQVSVSITNTGLSISLDSTGGGALSITEVGGGTTAADLGILHPNGTGVGPVVGSDLNPRLTKTTPLSKLLGASINSSSSIRVTNGGQTFDISFSGATTVEDVLNKFNGAGAGLVAEINEAGTGINIRSRFSGVDFSIGENGNTTASDLGLRTLTGAVRLEDLNHRFGVHDSTGNDFNIRRKDGVEFGIDVSGATTIQDVIDRINNHADNQDPAHKVTARLAQYGNGIELTTSDSSTAATLAVIKAPSSQAAIDLGLIADGATASGTPTSVGGVDILTGRDANPREVEGAFSALVRLRDALTANDSNQINRSIELLDGSTLTINNARAEIGARQEGLDTLQTRLGDEVISLKDSLSKEVDVDLTQAISELTSRQSAYQATLQTTAAVSKLSLLDFL